MNTFALFRSSVGARSLITASSASCFSSSSSSLLRTQPALYSQNTYSPFIRHLPRRNFAEITVKVPNLGDSVTEGNIASWLLNEGDFANKDQVVLSLETEKVGHEITAPEAGTIVKTFGKAGAIVNPGKPLFVIDTEKKSTSTPSSKPATPAAAAASSSSSPSKDAHPSKATSAPPPPSPSPSPAGSGRSASPPPPPPSPSPSPSSSPKAAAPAAAPAQPVSAPEAKSGPGTRDVERVPMSRMRKTIASNMKSAQNTLAMLTTFQECDMSALSNLRDKYKDEFAKKHNVKLGFMSAFVKASAVALQEIPAVNAVIDGEEVIYHKYVDISVAVATPRGLVTPVVRNCESQSFADIEKWIAFYSSKARDNKISMDELKGGTFTISNGGVFGSLMGTPIVNPGQSAILGLHAIKDRAVVVDGQIVIRPMMFLALTYDHRLVDGREAVTFLKRVKELVEEPSTILLS